MFLDAAILLLVFAAGYGLRAWISKRRRNAIRKARGDWSLGFGVVQDSGGPPWAGRV